jgi:RNA recognition motif-containing protein
MDSDQGKLFIGGISWETTEEKLRDYFKSYGEVAETVIMKDRATGRARGFGFVIFSDPTVADRVVLEKHTIDGRTVSLSLGLSLSLLSLSMWHTYVECGGDVCEGLWWLLHMRGGGMKECRKRLYVIVYNLV